MRDISGGPITVNHLQWSAAGVRKLVKHAGRNVDGLPGGDGLTFLAEAHFAGSFENEINFFLLLVMPRHLTAVGIERYVAQREVGGLNRAEPADHVLCQAPRRIATA